MRKKRAPQLVIPTEEELLAGQLAAQDLVDHMKRMGTAGTLFEILDAGTLWLITIEAQSAGGKPN